MTKQEQFRCVKDYFNDGYDEIVEHYMKTEGCYMISMDDGIVFAYRCNKASPYNIDFYGTDLYVQYATGNVKSLINICSDDIQNIIYDHKGRFKIYDLVKIKKIINKIR